MFRAIELVPFVNRLFHYMSKVSQEDRFCLVQSAIPVPRERGKNKVGMSVLHNVEHRIPIRVTYNSCSFLAVDVEKALLKKREMF
jgi:hypothetical protein